MICGLTVRAPSVGHHTKLAQTFPYFESHKKPLQNNPEGLNSRLHMILPPWRRFFSFFAGLTQTRDDSFKMHCTEVGVGRWSLPGSGKSYVARKDNLHNCWRVGSKLIFEFLLRFSTFKCVFRFFLQLKAILAPVWQIFSEFLIMFCETVTLTCVDSL